MRTVLTAIIYISLIACAQVDAEDAKRISDEYLKTRPDVDLARLTSDIKSSGSVWVITYSPPPNFAGGGPVITVSKKDGKIVSATFYQ